MVCLLAALVKPAATIMESENEFPENEFLVTGNLWFTTWMNKPPDNINDVISSLIRVGISGGARHPVVFTDQDSANIFLERMAKAKNVGSLGGTYSPRTLDDLQVFLGVLSQKGIDALGFDPFGDRVRIFPIERILDGIRNRHR